MNRALIVIILGSVAILAASRSALALTISPISSPAGYLSTDILSHDFESNAVGVPPGDSPPFSFEGSPIVGFAAAWTGGSTSSGLKGLVESVDDEPMRIVFAIPVHEVGMYFGNDDFERQFNANLELFDAGNNSLGIVQVLSNGNDFADQFIGARSIVAVKSAAIYFDRPNAGSLSVYIDDLIVGGLVPEPGGAALAVCGMLAMMTTHVRRAGRRNSLVRRIG